MTEYLFILWYDNQPNHPNEMFYHWCTESDMKLLYKDYANKAAQAYFYKKEKIPTAICVMTRIGDKAVIVEQEDFLWKL
jgi:hypothetical protein